MKDNEKRVSGGSNNRRRIRIINPEFQWKYAFTIALTVFLVSSIISAVLYGVLHHQARMRVIHPETYTTNIATTILYFALGISAVASGGVALWSVLVTHRICGPLFVLDRYFRELAQGRLPTIRALRRKDEFKSLFHSFAGAVDALKERKQVEVATLNEMVVVARNGLNRDDGQREALECIATRLEVLRREASQCLGEEVDESGSPAEEGAASPRQRQETCTPAGVSL